MASLLPPVEQQFYDQNGFPASGGTLDFYIVNTLTRKTTWQDYAQTIVNSNPVVLDSAGRATVVGSGAYRCVLKDALGNTIFDGQTDACLDDGLVSSFVLPWLSASNLSEFLSLSGLGTFIAAQLAAVALLPGPTGPVGPASTAVGPTGPQGPTGPAGSNGTDGTSSSGAMQCGVAKSDINGVINIAFAVPFPTSIVTVNVFSVLSPGIYDVALGSYQVNSYSVGGFNATIIDGNGGVLELTDCAWYAMGT